ncbi:hypothetical protein JCM10213_000605 [Rhodosporidiobolus nylandii]
MKAGLSALFFFSGAQVALVAAHMSIWHPSMFGVGANFSYVAGDPVAPIGPNVQTRDDWWFRGPAWRELKPAEEDVMELPAGGKVDVEIACNVAWTSYGARTTDEADELSACPDNPGAYHAGDPAGPVDDSLLSGCALGIADVDDIEDVKDLAIFSVNHQCVKQRMTNFEIPERMPPCTGNRCICAWFWLAADGTANFYMTGFQCNVTGSPVDAAPIAALSNPTFCGDDPGNCTAGAKRPLFVYNTPSNVGEEQWDNNNRPGYHASWGFQDGAQNDIFELAKVENRTSSRASSTPALPSSSTNPPHSSRASAPWPSLAPPSSPSANSVTTSLHPPSSETSSASNSASTSSTLSSLTRSLSAFTPVAVGNSTLAFSTSPSHSAPAAFSRFSSSVRPTPSTPYAWLSAELSALPGAPLSPTAASSPPGSKGSGLSRIVAAVEELGSPEDVQDDGQVRMGKREIRPEETLDRMTGR